MIPPERSRIELARRLAAVLDAPGTRYARLSASGGRSFADYVRGQTVREDEELLTEPVLEDLLRRVLGFPVGGYFPQLGRSGLKPDFTPDDLVAHRFVLDAKSSAQDLTAHEPQIRRYIDQRQLDFGVLFNLKELRVYRRGTRGHDRDLSFQLLPLWHFAKGEALAAEELERLAAFHRLFAYRALDRAQKIELIRRARPWTEREARGETVEVDIDFLVEQLRKLSAELAADASSQQDVLRRHVTMAAGREKSLLRELESIVLDISPGADLGDLPTAVDGYRTADGLAGKAWRQYLVRVAQLALTRIVLYRSWEDVEFVEPGLYDGGFGDVYDRLGHNVRRVLDEAFAHGYERYRWLYGGDNNYDWYRPREEALVNVLYALVPVPLGKLDADVLGGLYESYVDDIDRDRLGQFYTPRSVVRFMLDRAGFTGPAGVFRLEGDERKPRQLLDFATGSGGFLVEAARRIIDEGGVGDDDVEGLYEALTAVVRGFAGCELSPFPYYLTEVNLLLQVSRLLGRIRHAEGTQTPFVLGVVHADTLSSRPGPGRSIEGFDPALRADRAELVADERYGLIPLDAEKEEAFRRIRDGEFDLVVGNPPYVFESNNKVLFDRLRALPGWMGTYRGKSDYLYYFLLLAAEKVRLGGRMCVITPAGWMNAGNADWLREALSGMLRLDELFLFGSYRLFAPEQSRRRDRTRAPTPTVESAILVATKAPVPTGHKLRVVALEDEGRAALALSGGGESAALDRDALLGEMTTRVAGRAGRARGILVHDLRQDGLVSARPWPVKHRRQDLAAQVVEHLQRLLDDPDSPVERLLERWYIFQGIQTGADAYTARIQKRLPVEVKQRLAADGARTGEPIMELPPGWERRAPWASHPEALARSPESRALLYGAVDDADYASLVWLGRDDPEPADIVAALERWRPVLGTRAEIARNPSRRWWESAWPRDKDKLRGPKVIALYRTDRGRFALDESGDWQPSIKTTIATPKDERLSVAYLCGLLNSELLDLWFAVRGKTPRDVWRNYEPKAMAEIPYRHVPPSDPRRDVHDGVEGAVEAGDLESLRRITAAIGQDLRAGASPATEAATALASVVRALAANRRALLPHRRFVPELGRVVKDPWRAEGGDADRSAILASLDDAETVSVRIDPSLSVGVSSEGTLGRPELSGSVLRFTSSRQVTAQVEGPEERLRLLSDLVEARTRMLTSGFLTIRLPLDLDRLERQSYELGVVVGQLLSNGRALVEIAERLVCALFAVPVEVEEAVVLNAVARATRGGSR